MYVGTTYDVRRDNVQCTLGQRTIYDVRCTLYVGTTYNIRRDNVQSILYDVHCTSYYLVFHYRVFYGSRLTYSLLLLLLFSTAKKKETTRSLVLTQMDNTCKLIRVIIRMYVYKYACNATDIHE